MIVVRNVFQAKYGRGDELVAVLQEGRETLAKYGMEDSSSPISRGRSSPW